MYSSSAPRHSVDSLDPILSPSPTRNEYPFPRLTSWNQGGSETLASSRPGSSGRYQARRGSTASSINSIGGTLDTASHWHGLNESSQNAISTLLQPPIVRTGLIPHTSLPASSAHKSPTARDIPPVTLTNIPTVDSADFNSYLTQVGVLYDALQRAKENEEEGGTQILRKRDRIDDFADLLDPERTSSRRRTPNPSRQASLASLASSIETPSVRRRSSGATGRRAPQAPTPLSTIPNVYFEEDFHLENPRTFDVVSERSEVVKPVPGSPEDKRTANGHAVGPRKALATNAILQEKLSWYMDTIEVHLISSISSASSSFFAALWSLRELHSEAAESVAQIKTLRKELKALDEEMAISGLNIVSKKRRRENLKKLSDAVQQLKQIVEVVRDCETLVENSEVEKALDLIDSLEKLIAGEAHLESGDASIQLRDLRGATALQGVTTDLDTLRFRIGKIYETRFLNALMGDLRHHVELVSSAEILQRWSIASQRSRGGHNREPSVFPAYLVMSKEFRSELRSNLNGLHRARHTSPATTTYRESVLREIRNIVRRALPASNDDDADSMMSASTVGGGRHKSQQEKSSILARNLRALEPEDAEDLLKKTYIGIGETLRRLGTQVKMLLDVSSSLGKPEGAPLKSPPRSPNVAALDGRMMFGGPLKGTPAQELQEEMHQALDLTNLLGQAVDIAQDKIIKVLRVRSEQSVHLSVENFLRYFTLNLLFANECEAVSGRGGTALKNVVNTHIKEFVPKLTDSERQALASGMGADPWNAKDFTDSDREQLMNILSASTVDPDAWNSGSKIWIPSGTSIPPKDSSLLSVPTNDNSGTSTPSGAPTSRTTVHPAIIEGESYLLPVSAILCLHGLSSFLHLNTGLPSMTAEIATSIISYLTLFNSLCTQLILGAGATRSAGLKNITTKHLALAAQALAFIGNLIPHIREFVRRHSPSGSATTSIMGEFDKVRRAYQEHQESIYDKLVDIMSGRATAHAKAMKLIDWEQGGQGVNGYMETLAKETNTLHRVLSKHLPDMTVKRIMGPVFKSYKEQWGKAYGDVVLGSEAAQSRMLRDAEHFKHKIGGLDGAGDAGDYIVNLVKEKPIPRTNGTNGVDGAAVNGN